MTQRLKRIFSMSTPANTKIDETWNGKKLPTFDELPKFKDFAGCAWELWGKDDNLGTVNMLTDDVVQKAAAEEIKYAGYLFLPPILPAAKLINMCQDW
jgi:hypothetical protein